MRSNETTGQLVFPALQVDEQVRDLLTSNRLWGVEKVFAGIPNHFFFVSFGG